MNNKSIPKKNFIVVSTILGVVAITLLALLIYFIVRSNTYAIQLENTYKKSFFELASNIENVEVNLSKLIATNDNATQSQLLNDIYQTSNTANGNLSALPITNNKVKSVNKFLNTLGGYSYSLLEKVNDGGQLDQSDYDNITWLHRQSKSANYDINNYVNNLDDNFNILSQVKYGNGDASLWEGGLTNVESSTNKLPTLIYDGPFSDSVLNKDIKGLPGGLITQDQALQILKEHFKYFDNYNFKYVGDTIGKFATYNYEAIADNHKLYVQITKEGGFILSINDLHVGGGKPIIDIKQSETLAHNFASLMGADNMQTVWTQQSGNVVYLNLAPVVDDVVYYPDLIKVKVDRAQGTVVGWEATNYAYNHTQRPEFESKIGLEEGKQYISDALTIGQARYAVIPDKWVGENNAIEYVCEWEDYTYYVYISAIDGSELNILRVIDTTSGSLLQ